MMFALLPLLLAALSLQPQPATSTGTLHPGGRLIGVDEIIVEEDPYEPLTEPVIITIERIDIQDYPRLRQTCLPNFVVGWQGSHYIIKVIPVNDPSELSRVLRLVIKLPLPSDPALNDLVAAIFNPAELQMPGIAGPPRSPSVSATAPRCFIRRTDPHRRIDYWNTLSGEVIESGTHFRFSTGIFLNTQEVYGLPIREIPTPQTSR